MRYSLVTAISLSLLAGCGSAEGADTGETGAEPPSFEPLSSAPTTLEERREATHDVADGDLDPRIPEERDSMLDMGYGDWEAVAGEDILDLTFTGEDPPASGGGAARLARFVHLADMQLVDDESPTRVCNIDAIGPTGAAFRPQDSYGCYALNAVVRTINALDAADPYDFVVLGGDNADSAQRNELTWFRDLMDGGVQVHCDSGEDDDPIEGELNDPKDPLVTEGLNPPWRWVTGNHDILVQGNFTLESRQDDAIGSENSAGTRDWSMPGAPVVSGEVVADEARELLFEGEVVSFMAETGDGHGLDGVTGEKAEYTFDQGDLRFIVISTAAQTGGADGVYTQAQIDDFLRPALEAGEAEGKWMFVVSHHAAGSLTDGTGLGGTVVDDAVTPAEFEQLLGSFSHLVVHLAGHSHNHRVTVKGGGDHAYWELQTAAIADYPHQMREIEVHDQDNGFLSITGIALDFDLSEPLAAEFYRLGTMDMISGWVGDGSGGSADRNVRLWFPKP